MYEHITPYPFAPFPMPIDYEDMAEKFYRGIEAQTSTANAQAFLESAQWLIDVRAGKIKTRYKKLLLENGEPVKKELHPVA